MSAGSQLEVGHHVLPSRDFERLVERHRDGVYGFALRMTRSERDAAEIAQESFLSAFLHLAQFRNEADFTAWVYQIAARHAFLRIPSVAAAPAADQMQTALHERPARDWSRGVDEVPLNGQLRRAIEEAADALPPGQREVLLLKDLAGLNYEQIASIIRLSIPAIKSRLHQARLHLRAAIDRFYRSQRTVPFAWTERRESV